MEDAKLYTTQNAYQRGVAINVLKEFASQLSWTEEYEHVLEVGCGPGDITTQILLPQLPENVSLVGIDISSMMIKFAKENYSRERVSFKCLDFASQNISKQFSTNFFSKIFSFSCLHWIKDQNQMVHNLYTLLNPGGELLSVMVQDSEFFPAIRHLSDLEPFRQYCQNVEDIIPSESYSCEDLKKRLIAKGFDVITCEWRATPFTYPSLETTTKSFEAINPFVKRMPKEVKKAYLDTFKEILLTPRVSASGEVTVLHKTVVVFARRPIDTVLEL